MSAPKAIGQLARPLAARMVGRKALGLARLIRDWPTVAGGGAAGRACPDGLSFPRGRGEGGTLTLRTDPADALELQHDIDRLLQRINRHMGHALIARIRLVQAPHRLPARPATRASRASVEDPARGADRDRAVERVVATVGSDDLRQSLAQLGRSLYRRDETEGGA